MPTYEYACRDCGEHLEVVQSFKDDPLTVCPACQGQLRKVFSAAGIVFKGSGWHIKDYASSRSSSSSAEGGASEAKGEGSSKETSTKDAASPSTSGPGESAEKSSGKSGSSTASSSEKKTA